MYSSRRPSRKFEDLTDEWQGNINALIEHAWAEPAHRRSSASALHLVDQASAAGQPARHHLDQFLQTISATRRTAMARAAAARVELCAATVRARMTAVMKAQHPRRFHKAR